MTSKLDQAFASIEEGNELLDRNEFLEASKAFHKATLVLEQHAKVANDEKVASLLSQQRVEYLKKGQSAFISYLETIVIENNEGGCAESHSFIPVAHRQQGHQLFIDLFLNQEMKSDHQRTTERVLTTNSLEERLQRLNMSMPKPLKSDQERLHDLHQGMERLGWTLHSSRGRNGSNVIFSPKSLSESEQIDEIINQANDEVAISNLGNLMGCNTSTDYHDDDILDVGDDESTFSSSSQGLKLSSHDLTTLDIETLQDHMASAQAKLAELVALFQLDEDEDAEIQFESSYGRKTLRDAIQELRRAEKFWKSRKGSQ